MTYERENERKWEKEKERTQTPFFHGPPSLVLTMVFIPRCYTKQNRLPIYYSKKNNYQYTTKQRNRSCWQDWLSFFTVPETGFRWIILHMYTHTILLPPDLNIRPNWIFPEKLRKQNRSFNYDIFDIFLSCLLVYRSNKLV